MVIGPTALYQSQGTGRASAQKVENAFDHSARYLQEELDHNVSRPRSLAYDMHKQVSVNQMHRTRLLVTPVMGRMHRLSASHLVHQGLAFVDAAVDRRGSTDAGT